MDATTLFLSHGSPMMVLEDTPARRFLTDLGKTLPRPRAVVVASAHFAAEEPVVGFAARPEKINDMYGFPPELYRMSYAPPGDPVLAGRVADLLGPGTRRDPKAGIDHGVWSIMSLLWPEADMPVVPLSVMPGASPREQYDLGRRLRPLAEDGVMVIGSGAATHNLRDYVRKSGGREVAPAVQAFTDWLAQAVEGGDAEALLDYRRRAPEAERSHPTDEHLLPLFLALGAAPDGTGRRIHHSVDAGIIAMDAYAFA